MPPAKRQRTRKAAVTSARVVRSESEDGDGEYVPEGEVLKDLVAEVRGMRREMGKLTRTVAGLGVQVAEMWSWVGELGESDYVESPELSEEDPEKEMGAEELEELLGEFERNNETAGRRVMMVKEALEVEEEESEEESEELEESEGSEGSEESSEESERGSKEPEE